MSPEWELQFPLMTLRAATSLGSDHTPLVLDSRSESPVGPTDFSLKLAGLRSQVSRIWLQANGLRMPSK
jgi:hypothetical protein